MCGIGTISPAPGSKLPVRALTRWLLIDLAARGRDAAGIAWQKPDGGTLYRKSAGHPAGLARYVSQKSGSRSLDQSRAVIVHTRWMTHGTPTNPLNNHPIIRPGIALVHNGTVSNPAALHKLASTTPQAQVDSDALAAIVSTAKTQRGLEGRLRTVEGAAVIAWLDVTNDPEDADSLWVARIDTRPYVIGFTRAGDCIGASTLTSLTAACKTAQVKLADTLTLSEGDMLNIKGGEIASWSTLGTGSGKQEDASVYARPAARHHTPADEWTLDDALAVSGD